MYFSAAIVIEILACGVEASVWVLAVLLSVTNLARVLGNVPEGLGPLIVASGLVLAYALGVVIDRLADLVFLPADKLLQARFLTEGTGEPTMRMRVLHESEGLCLLLGYARSRVRIARSVALNLLILLVVAISLSLSIEGWGKGICAAPTVTSAAIITPMLIVAVVAWVRLSAAYYQRLAESYSIVDPRETPRGQEQPDETTA